MNRLKPTPLPKNPTITDMKASELIAKLQTLILEHGDLEVTLVHPDYGDLSKVRHAQIGDKTWHDGRTYFEIM